MIALTAGEAAQLVGGRLAGSASTDTVVTSVVTDSREAGPGSLFVAIRGERLDGHAHAAGAVERGAVLVLADHEPGGDGGDAALPFLVVPDTTAALGDLARGVLARLRSRSAREPRPHVVAVTGSVGKTTTKDLLAHLFSAQGPTVAPVRSFNNEVGLPVTVLRCDESTTDLVLEMGADAPGNIDYLTRIAPPDVACVLVVGNAHLAGMGGVDGVAAEKASILAALPEGGTAVLNADDQRVRAMAEGVTPGRRILTFGRAADADVRADDIVVRQARVAFTLVSGAERAPVALRLVGEHHLTNALAAAAVALASGLGLADVATGLSSAGAASPHRMAVSELGDGVTLIDDSYNANPDSMRAALKALVALGRGRRTVAILGEMRELGPDSLLAHDAIGRLAVRLDVDRLLVVGTPARAMFTGALLEGSFGEEAAFVETPDDALAWWEANRQPGDVLLVKSSNGAELYRLADDIVAASGPTSKTGHEPEVPQ
ncbi:MAG: UDP-N-acetylmuramoyl-tripeptide--D-alanyl-D-alanine ligase [Micrococcales bacterium 73-15]|uniref:UDP-N-acetylmuramoyl-tripeptide--D-alanyl-D- alanine ligase n=1 Tax=Salana multivorans TaxID=120377 RepID=UPI00095BE271|nr:UDP-N-acetylmuramoyl-tripeptide--D-alanyl-D-alanine ligase [Salana multivorans]OJX95610.1 MAG: UDP-N-acetylmuramoyl-tripeptide--D-alanyl-D-alanine ligase [Micrococcales bacterium 73-15]